jgi:hypothetical protein
MNRQWKGIVFLDFRDENAPHFILNLIEELQREKVAESIAPCQTFAKSFMMISPATGRKDLVFLLRPLSEGAMNRLESWRNNQGEQIVMILPEYVKQYSAEFTGIGQSLKADDSDKKIEPTNDNPLPKPKKEHRKRKQPSKQTGQTDSSTNDESSNLEASEDSTEALEVSGEDEVEIEGT